MIDQKIKDRKFALLYVGEEDNQTGRRRRVSFTSSSFSQNSSQEEAEMARGNIEGKSAKFWALRCRPLSPVKQD